MSTFLLCLRLLLLYLLFESGSPFSAPPVYGGGGGLVSAAGSHREGPPPGPLPLPSFLPSFPPFFHLGFICLQYFILPPGRWLNGPVKPLSCGKRRENTGLIYSSRRKYSSIDSKLWQRAMKGISYHSTGPPLSPPPVTFVPVEMQ